MMNDSNKDLPNLTIAFGAEPLETEHLRGGRLTIRSPFGVRPAERLMLEALPEGKPGRYVVAGSNLGITAEVLARLNPGSSVTDLHIDSFHHERAVDRLRGIRIEASEVSPLLAADWPDGDAPWSGACIIHSKNDDSALAQERIAEALRTLAPRGLLTFAVDTPRDHQMRERMKRVFGDVTLRTDESKEGVVYVSRKKPDAKSPKPPYFEEFSFSEGETTLVFTSRPGVFSAGRLDDGARALIREMSPRDGEHVVDIGCGLGVVGIAAATRANLASITLLDANVRALELAQRNADRNLAAKGTPVKTFLTAHPESDLSPESADLCLLNPPYFSNFQIAQAFIDGARRALKPRGRAEIVTKQPDWYRQSLPSLFRDVSEKHRGGYVVFVATRA